jgi:hypothetical protein
MDSIKKRKSLDAFVAVPPTDTEAMEARAAAKIALWRIIS